MRDKRIILVLSMLLLAGVAFATHTSTQTLLMK